MSAAASGCSLSRWSSATSNVARSHYGLSPIRFNNCKLSSYPLACFSPISIAVLYSHTLFRTRKPKQASRFIAESKQQQLQPSQQNLNHVGIVDELTLEKHLMRVLKRFPDKVSCQVNIVRNLSALIVCGASPMQMTKLFRANPALFHCDLFDNINLAHRYFSDVGMTKKQIFMTLLRFSHLITGGITEIKIVENFLIKEIGVRKINSIIKSHSYIFGIPLSTLRSRANSIQKLGLNPLGYIIERAPILLKYNENDLNRKVKYFQKLIGNEKYVQFLCKTPRILARRTKAVNEIYDNLVLLYGKEEAMDIVERQPAVLNVAWPIIKEKIIFIQETMNRGLDEISLNPTVLTCSLEKRIKPRFLALKSVGISHTYCLGFMFYPTDIDFIARFGVLPILDQDTIFNDTNG